MASTVDQTVARASAATAIPVVSIIIVSWNTRELLGQCLQSVWQELTTTYGAEHVEVVVVDNGSTDGSIEHIRQHFPWVQLFINPQNSGFAGGNNLGLTHCHGRYVLLLNPDTRLLPGSLGALVNFLDTHPAAGAVGSRLLNPDSTLQMSCYPRPTLARELWRLFHLDRLAPYALYPVAYWPVDRAHEVDVVQGASMLLRRELLEALDGLDPAYFMYSEEVDLCYRVQQAGWRIYWVPTSAVIHYGGQSTQQVAATMFLHLYRSKILYFRKNHGWLAAQLYKLILVAVSLTRLCASPVAWLQHTQKRTESLALAGHYGRLLLALPKM